jgi:hypothetical protein
LLVHPFSLHCFFLEPCCTHTPAFLVLFEHCGKEHFMWTPCRWQDPLPWCFLGFLLHPSCEQIVFTMINSGVLIMLVVEWLEDVGCGCEETSPYVACSTRSHEADNRSCERLQTWKWDESSVRGCKNWEAAKLAENFNCFWRWYWLRCLFFCEETMWVLWEDGQIWSARTPLWEGGKLRGRKIRERGEKLRGRKKIFMLNYWLPASSSSVYP